MTSSQARGLLVAVLTTAVVMSAHVVGAQAGRLLPGLAEFASSHSDRYLAYGVSGHRSLWVYDTIVGRDRKFSLPEDCPLRSYRGTIDISGSLVFLHCGSYGADAGLLNVKTGSIQRIVDVSPTNRHAGPFEGQGWLRMGRRWLGGVGACVLGTTERWYAGDPRPSQGCDALLSLRSGKLTMQLNQDPGDANELDGLRPGPWTPCRPIAPDPLADPASAWGAHVLQNYGDLGEQLSRCGTGSHSLLGGHTDVASDGVLSGGWVGWARGACGQDHFVHALDLRAKRTWSFPIPKLQGSRCGRPLGHTAAALLAGTRVSYRRVQLPHGGTITTDERFRVWVVRRPSRK